MGLEYDAMELETLSTYPTEVSKQFFSIMGIFSSIPIGHSVQMKETHNSMDHLLSAVDYQEHKWLICGDVKMVGLILGLQGGYAKYPCFLCLWDSLSDKSGPLRQGLKPGLHKVQSHTLVEPNKILLPHLHIKLGVTKNFVKAMDREGDKFAFHQEKFPWISMEKL